MTTIVTGGDGWGAHVAEGPAEWRVTYHCPGCNGLHVLLLQPPPWSEPVGRADEARRRAGGIEHRDVDDVSTQLWCHRCGRGADVIVSSS